MSVRCFPPFPPPRRASPLAIAWPNRPHRTLVFFFAAGIKDAAAEVNNGCSLLIMVGADVDAICAARILVVRALIRCEQRLCPFACLLSRPLAEELTNPCAPHAPAAHAERRQH